MLPMKKCIILMLACSLGIAYSQVSRTIEDDSLALLALYNSTDGDNWDPPVNWMTDFIIAWEGIGIENNRVINIDLANRNLNGTIPAAIGNIDSLKYLNLYSNTNLSGELPVELGSCHAMVDLGIFNTSVAGSIPAELGQLTHMVYCNLSNNQLSGTIPDAFFTISSLKWLFLFGNQLSGSLPSTISNLTNIINLSLQDNQFSGTIPDNFTGLDSLQELRLHDNQLSGSIPNSICNLPRLQILALWNNQLSEEIPSDIGLLTNLTYLSLASNQLSGSIPPSIGDLSNLMELNLTFNSLTGAIPAEIGSLTSLVVLYIHNNKLTEAIPASIGNLENLKSLDLGVNQLSGNLPAEFWNLSKLKHCILCVNQLTGTLPEQIGNMDSLQYLDLGDNSFSDALPAAFTGLSKLRVVWIGSNDLSGNLPSDIGSMTALEELALYGNALTGSIPASIVDCSNLRLLYLQNNQLDGSIPTDIGSLQELQDLGLSDNTLSGTIPTSIGSCSKLRSLNVSNNNFIGAIPVEIGSLNQLIELNLGFNQLDGAIPSEVYSLNNLIFLDLAYNAFTGALDTLIGNLANLEVLYLGGNQLSETIPGQLGKLVNLKVLFLHDNNFNGTLPPDLENLINLESCALEANSFSGDIPDGFSAFTKLHTFRIFDNAFSGLPDLSALPLTDFQVQNNRLIFEDIVPNVGITTDFVYAPQDSVGESKSPAINAGDNLTLDAAIAAVVGNNYNIYQWFKNNAQIPDATTDKYDIVNADNYDNGVYTCRIDNNVADQLTLWQRPIRVTVAGEPPPAPQLTLPDNEAEQVPTNQTFAWGEAAGATDYHWQLATSGTFTAAEIVQQESELTDNVNTTSGLETDKTYYWRVRAHNSFGYSDWSAVWSFYTISSLPVPGKTILSKPDSNAVNQPLTLDLTWEKSLVNGEGVYVLEVAENPSFSPIFAEAADVDNEMYRLENLKPGQTYWWRVYASNAAGDGEWSNVWHFTTFKPPAISADGPTELSPVTVVLNGMVNPNGIATDVTFEIGQSTDYDRTVPAEQNPVSGTTETAVSAFVDQLYIGATYHYRVVATSEAGSTATGDLTFTTEAYPAQYTLALSASFPSRPNPRDYRAADYRMLGIPGSCDLSVKDFMSGEPGEDWMVVWDNGAEANFFVRFDDSQEFNCLPGRAFWVVARTPINSSRSIMTAALNNEDAVEIAVHKGWNLITNPFDSPVSWPYVQQHNAITEPIHSFDGSWNTAEAMQPYRGYYYFHNTNTNVLRIPLHAAYTRSSVKTKNPIEWQMKLTLMTPGFVENSTSIGVSSEAQTAQDQFDFRKPRALETMPGITFIRPEWDPKYPHFARDIRPLIEKIEKWEFEVSANRFEFCELRVHNVMQIPETQQVFLIDLMHAAYRDLREDTVYAFTPVIDCSPFAIVVGEETAVQKELTKIIPHDFSLENNFPNPFNPVTTIPVSVPQDAFVTIKVYNILGQEIETLYRGTLTTGRHYLTWNGSRYASGIYYCRLRSQSGKTATSKMVFAK
jgi:Leucine-rich repeat (LRR) protein